MTQTWRRSKPSRDEHPRDDSPWANHTVRSFWGHLICPASMTRGYIPQKCQKIRVKRWWVHVSSMNLGSREYIHVYGEDMPRLAVTGFSTKQVRGHDAAPKRCQVIRLSWCVQRPDRASFIELCHTRITNKRLSNNKYYTRRSKYV